MAKNNDVGVRKTVNLSEIVESKSNPRLGKLDVKKTEELAASLAEKGLLNPVVLRKTADGFEIVAGHRRFAAAKSLKWEKIEALYYETLTDDQAIEIAIIENVQREDLPPADEAKAYARLRDESEMTVAEISAKTGKSESHIFARLSLLKLGEEGLKAIADGRLSLVGAGILGRIHDDDDRKVALDSILKSVKEDGKVTDQEIRDYVAENILRALKSVSWDLDDMHLVPEAGACSTCPKNTANQKTLFADMGVKDARCNDGSCFASKVKAKSKIVLEKAKKDGQKVLTDITAIKAIDRSYSEGYKRMNDTEWVNGKNISVRALVANLAKKSGKEIPTTIAVDPRSGRVVELVSYELASDAEHAFRGHSSSGIMASPQQKAKRKAEIRQQKLDREARFQVIALLVEKVEKLSISKTTQILEILAYNRVRRASYLDEINILKRRGIEPKKDHSGQIEKYFKTLSWEQKIALGFECEAIGYAIVGSNPAECFPELEIKLSDGMALARKALDKAEKAKIEKVRPALIAAGGENNKLAKKAAARVNKKRAAKLKAKAKK